MRSILALILSSAIALPVQGLAQNVAGPYLAARAANMANDYEAASEYYLRALVRDRQNPAIMENAILSLVGLGEIDEALPIARVLVDVEPNNAIAGIVLTVVELRAGPTDEILAALAAGDQIGPLLDQLLLGWAELQRGRVSSAMEAFDVLATTDEYRDFGLFHKGLALALVGDFEGAEEILSGRAAGQVSQTRRGVLAYAQILGQLGRAQEGADFLESALDLTVPEIGQLHDRLSSGEAVPFDIITSATDGMGEAVYSLAVALNGQSAEEVTLLYARVASYLAPNHTDALLLTASLLEGLEQYDLATAVYDQVPSDSPAYMSAEIGRAEALSQSGKSEVAVEVLMQLAKSHAEVPLVHLTLGDTFRRMSRFEESVASYDKAISLFGAPEPEHWFAYYVRGISNERIDDWPAAEADFRMSLELNPGHPSVLNYLGYSLVEKREDLDEALAMIRQAVDARPDSGYITDSLGWVLYRLGRFEEAVLPMERAAALMPLDAVVNDHLGDVYWAVGRAREAQFQWRRALSFVDPEEENPEAKPDRIRRKLEVGLDTVLEEEGAPSLAEKAAIAAEAAAQREAGVGSIKVLPDDG